MEEQHEKSRSTKEKELIVNNLVDNYKEIIENKKTDGTSVKEKISAWNDKETQFNVTARYVLS